MNFTMTDNVFVNRMRKAMQARGLKQADIVKRTGLGKSAISQYYNGIYKPKQKATFLIAKALGVHESWLLGLDVPMDRSHANIIPFKTKKVPLLGTIAAGEPIYADEQCEAYIEIDQSVHVDFCVRVKGDSMINARIKDGDLVFIRQQPEVEAGEIAAVLIDNDVTLKRFYKNDQGVILKPENGNYQPIFYTEKDFKEIKILGKAMFFQGKVC